MVNSRRGSNVKAWNNSDTSERLRTTTERVIAEPAVYIFWTQNLVGQVSERQWMLFCQAGVPGILGTQIMTRAAAGALKVLGGSKMAVN
jgi:hypothetical protein